MPCPLSGNCLSECVVYEATIAHGGTETKYYGSTGNTFKERYRNHLSSFKLSHKSNETTLSTFVWDNGLNPTPEVRWRIIGKRRKVQPNGLCGVCNLEKLTILKSGPNTLNKRDEILRKCPHRDKNSLAKCWHLRAPGGCTTQHSHRRNSQRPDPIGSDDATVELMIVGESRHETICIRGESFYSFWIITTQFLLWVLYNSLCPKFYLDYLNKFAPSGWALLHKFCFFWIRRARLIIKLCLHL